ncbi:hypothetical protein ACFWWA_19985 [Streptomyces goshikiensis]|uniref:hypothetical protein n=1 Tax=Streptomyces goshikiensis TaxID=1942 RepID=UPI00364BE44C
MQWNLSIRIRACMAALGCCSAGTEDVTSVSPYPAASTARPNSSPPRFSSPSPAAMSTTLTFGCAETSSICGRSFSRSTAEYPSASGRATSVWGKTCGAWRTELSSVNTRPTSRSSSSLNTCPSGVGAPR